MIKRVLITIALLYLIAIGFGTWGYAVHKWQIFPYSIIHGIQVEISGALTEAQKKSAADILTTHHQERRNHFDYAGFVRRDQTFRDPGYLLISGFSRTHGQVVVDLVRLNPFERLHQWIPPVREILSRGKKNAAVPGLHLTEAGFRVQHPLLLGDGSLVFGHGEGYLARIDKNNKLLWVNSHHFHHSIEMDAKGRLVTAINISPPALGYSKQWRDDGYAILSVDGKILEIRSVGRILRDNGYEGLFRAYGYLKPEDRLHLNDIQPVDTTKGIVKQGDLALSLRNPSTVALYRPSTNTITAFRTGPWLLQHDINRLADGRFSVFNNFLNKALPNVSGPISTMMIWDPETGAVESPYESIMKKARVHTNGSGRGRILPNGDAFIEETERDRMLRVSREKVRWEYVNAPETRPDISGALHWSRYYLPAEIPLAWLKETS